VIGRGVTQRWQQIPVRLALGTPRQLVRMVIGSGCGTSQQIPRQFVGITTSN
jgi:hypothetical protein